MSVSYGRGAKAKATRLHSQVVRARGRCERCGKIDGTLQCAHIVSRRYTATRTDERNAWCLCFPCHRWLTEHPDQHVAFAIQTLGDAGYRELLDKAYAGAKSNAAFWLAEVERLQALLKEAA